MNIRLEPLEARVIGCLIEKSITTPDQYPLSLNALTLACNQKSNRDPVLDLDDATVQRTVDVLSRRHMIMERSGFGSRVPKYQHLFCNTEYGSLRFTPQELAIICELLLRGPQTPGELRTRASRMAPFGDVTEVDAALETLATRADGPFVVRLPREAGRRDSRYAQRFGEYADFESAPVTAVAPATVTTGSATAGLAQRPPAAAPGDLAALLARIDALEARVSALEAAPRAAAGRQPE
jgi:uncharacterized protein YceH (UPF0502 family)